MRFRPLALLTAVLLAGGGLGWWLGRRAAVDRLDASPHAVAGGALLLEARPQLMGYGAWYGFTVDRAGTLRMTVDLPDGVSSTLLWGPPGGDAARGHWPDPASLERIALRGPMSAPLERRVRTLGPHVLLVEQAEVTMGHMDLPTHVRVELVPDHPDCTK